MSAQDSAPAETIAVIGLGYVGLTTAVLAARAGFQVLGVDTDHARLEMLAAGHSPFGETDPDLHALCTQMISTGALRVAGELTPSDVVFVAVPTPVLPSQLPDERPLVSALAQVAKGSPHAGLVVLESTLAPGTMRRLVAPFMSSPQQRFVHAPERIMPGKLLTNATNMPKVLGVESDTAWERARVLFGRWNAGPLRRTTWANAELCKTAENAWRDLNIAFANTLAMACESAGGDFETVRALVNESPGRNVLKAGVGVGGSCLPKDTLLLSSALPADEFLRAGRRLNAAMPHHAAALARRCVGGDLTGKRVLVLGASYLEDVPELAGSPALAFACALRDLGAEVLHHDPHVPGYGGDVLTMAEGCHLIALATDHSTYARVDFGALVAAVPAETTFLDLRCSNLATVARKSGFRVMRLGG